jgi:hypothetical protein
MMAVIDPRSPLWYIRTHIQRKKTYVSMEPVGRMGKPEEVVVG